MPDEPFWDSAFAEQPQPSAETPAEKRLARAHRLANVTLFLGAAAVLTPVATATLVLLLDNPLGISALQLLPLGAMGTAAVALTIALAPVTTGLGLTNLILLRRAHLESASAGQRSIITRSLVGAGLSLLWPCLAVIILGLTYAPAVQTNTEALVRFQMEQTSLAEGAAAVMQRLPRATAASSSGPGASHTVALPKALAQLSSGGTVDVYRSSSGLCLVFVQRTAHPSGPGYDYAYCTGRMTPVTAEFHDCRHISGGWWVVLEQDLGD